MGEEDSIVANLTLPEECNVPRLEEENNVQAIGKDTLAGYISDSVKVTPTNVQGVMKNAATDR